MKKKLKMNPILKKELMVGSRNMKMSWGIFGFNIMLAGIVLFVMAMISISAGFTGYDYSKLITLFPVLGFAECLILSLVVPIITSGSISGERERQTLDIMLTTPVKPFAIAMGKLQSALSLVMVFMISSIPIMAILFVLGGMSWFSLFGLIIMMLYLGTYVGSVGIFCSSFVKKSIGATVLTIIIGIGIISLTLIAFGSGVSLLAYYYTLSNNALSATSVPGYNLGPIPIVLMFNPYSPFVDFMIRTMTSASLYELFDEIGDLPWFFEILYKAWIPVSMIINLLISFGFLKLAARNIAVTRNKKSKGK